MKNQEKTNKVLELRDKIKDYANRVPFDIRKVVERECMMMGIDSFIVFCDKSKFEIERKKLGI